jgi:hypothetical protein
MSDILTSLTMDFLAWLEREPRTYADVMDAWRTSCPRLTIWEDAIDNELIAHRHVPGQPALIELTARGEALLATHRAAAGTTWHAGRGAPLLPDPRR